jgi:hypothetical protein
VKGEKTLLMHFHHTLRLLDPSERGNARIENKVVDAESWFQIEGKRHEHEDLGTTDFLPQLIGLRFVDPIDQHGLVDVGEWCIPEDKDPFGALHRAVVASLRYDVPERPLRIGDQWRREVGVPEFPGARATWTSTLERMEKDNGRWAAVISRDLDVRFQGPMTWPGAQETMHRWSTDLTAEGRFLIEEGHWLSHRLDEVRREAFTLLEEGAEPGSKGPPGPVYHRLSRALTTIEISDFAAASGDAG